MRLRMSRDRTADCTRLLRFFAPDTDDPSVIFFTRANCCLLYFKASPFLRGSLLSNDYTSKSHWSKILFSYNCRSREKSITCVIKKKSLSISHLREQEKISHLPPQIVSGIKCDNYRVIVIFNAFWWHAPDLCNMLLIFVNACMCTMFQFTNLPSLTFLLYNYAHLILQRVINVKYFTRDNFMIKIAY